MFKLPGCVLAFSLLYGKASSSGKGGLLNSTLAVAMTTDCLCLQRFLAHQNIGGIFSERGWSLWPLRCKYSSNCFNSLTMCMQLKELACILEVFSGAVLFLILVTYCFIQFLTDSFRVVQPLGIQLSDDCGRAYCAVFSSTSLSLLYH